MFRKHLAFTTVPVSILLFFTRRASISDVATPCPDILLARFSYGICLSTEEFSYTTFLYPLEFCTDSNTARADYTKCSTKILNSDVGVLSCVGFVRRGSETFVNLFKHDTNNGFTCLKIQNSGGDGIILSEYYTGDCTTSSLNSLTLTKTSDCSTVAATTIAERNTSSPAVSKDNTRAKNIVIIAGAVAAGFLCLLVAAVVGYILISKTKRSKVSDTTNKDGTNLTAENPQEISKNLQVIKPISAHEVSNGITPEVWRETADQTDNLATGDPNPTEH